MACSTRAWQSAWCCAGVASRNGASDVHQQHQQHGGQHHDLEVDQPAHVTVAVGIIRFARVPRHHVGINVDRIHRIGDGDPGRSFDGIDISEGEA